MKEKPAYHRCPLASGFYDSLPSSADLITISDGAKVTYHVPLNGHMLVYETVRKDGKTTVYIDGYRKTTLFRTRAQVVPEAERAEVESGLRNMLREGNESIRVLFLS